VDSREKKEAHLALVTYHISRLDEQAKDLRKEANLLREKKQSAKHIADLLFPILSSMLTLSTIRKNLRIELESPSPPDVCD